MSLKKVKNISPSELNDIKSLQKAVQLLLNAVEELSRENELLNCYEERAQLRSCDMEYFA